MEHLREYAAQPLSRFLEYWEDSRRLLEVSMTGMSALKDIAVVLEQVRLFVAKIGLGSPNTSQKDLLSNLQKAERDAAYSQKEIDAGFPLLHAHTLVGAWGALEAAIEDMLVGILLNEPRHLQDPSLGKIRIPLAEFEALEKEDRMRLLIEEIRRNNPSGRKNGNVTFESLLERFLLSGPVNADISRDIWEANQVRNVIVHRNSIADRHLVKSCPWMKMNIGDKVIITSQQIDRYGHALCEYVATILRRLEVRYGVDPTPKRLASHNN